MLVNNKIKVAGLVASVSKRFGVKVVKYANVGNHLHLVVRLPAKGMTSKIFYGKWIRLLTSRVAFEIGGGKKGEPLKDGEGNRAKFWDAVPFSRVIHDRRGWKTIDRYVLKNELEAQGLPKVVAIAMAAKLYDSNRALDLPDWSTQSELHETA